LAAAAADGLVVAGDEDLVVVDRCSPTDVTLFLCGGNGTGRFLMTFAGSVAIGPYSPA